MIREHLNRKQWRYLCLIGGIALILIGIIVCFLINKAQYDHCAHRYLNDLDGFGTKYDSLWDCFVTRSTGSMILSLLAGSIPFLCGCFLIRNR